MAPYFIVDDSKKWILSVKRLIISQGEIESFGQENEHNITVIPKSPCGSRREEEEGTEIKCKW